MSSRTLKGNRFSLIALFKFSAPALLAQAMKLARKGMTTKPGVTGKIRAKGVNSGTIYDLG